MQNILSEASPVLIRCLMWHLCQSVRARGWSQMRVDSPSLCIWVTRQPKPRVIPPQAPRRHLSSTYLKMTYRLVTHTHWDSFSLTHSQTVRFCLLNHACFSRRPVPAGVSGQYRWSRVLYPSATVSSESVLLPPWCSERYDACRQGFGSLIQITWWLQRYLPLPRSPSLSVRL